MPRFSPELPRDLNAEAQLERQIQSLNATLQETLQRLAEAKTELEIRRQAAYGIVPKWLKPKNRASIAETTMNILNQNWQGLKFAEIEREIRRSGREVHKPTLTATLGRLKRDEKIVRRKGRWKILTYSDRPEPEEPPEREYDKEVHMD